MSLNASVFGPGQVSGNWTPPRYMVLYDCTPLAGNAVLRAFEHATSGRASVFIAGLRLPDPEGARPHPDLRDELDALVRAGKPAASTSPPPWLLLRPWKPLQTRPTPSG